MSARPLIAWLWGPWSPLAAVVVAVTAVLDQAHKWWMLKVVRIELGQRIEVTPFFDWYFVINKGVSYGMAAGDVGQGLLVMFSLAASVALMVWLAVAGTGRLMALSLGLIVGGAIGNAIDRLIHGGVADFFSLHAYGFYWYVFNVADVAIVAGVLGLLYDSLVPNRKDVAKAS
jgi:signal peptidase II